MHRIAMGTLSTIVLSAQIAAGQVARVGGQKVKPRATAGDTLTVTASPSVVTFTLHENQLSTGSAPVVIVSSFAGISLLGSFVLYGFFASSSAALSGGTPVANIPTTLVLGQVPTGTPTTFTAFTSTGPFGGAGASLQLFSASTFLVLVGSRTDNLNLEINLVGITQQPAATYMGTLTLEVQAM
jgi:hypothetical protein